MASKFFILTIIFFILALQMVSAEKIVLFAMDDFQTWWLEDVQESIIKVHIDNDIPVTLGVIPSGIEDEWGAGERLIERIQRWDAEQIIEVAQHGYNHSPLGGLDYESQYTQIKKGKELMNNAGVFPKSFISPFNSADDNTIKVLRELEFHTFYSSVYINITPAENPLIITNQLMLQENNGVGKDFALKDYSTLKSQIDQKINEQGVALVSYHMQDFESNSGGINQDKALQLVTYADNLKGEGYTLMTVEQYYQYLNELDNDKDNDGYIDLIDCDDNNANVWRLLNGYADNDKDRYGSWNRISICSGNTLPSGYSYIGRDCDDSNAAINPMVIDRTCDGIDNNCNGRIDESYIRLVTTCGTGLCMSMGNLQCISGNVIDSCTPKVSSPEKCNNLFDDDCDGKIDKADEDCIVKNNDKDNDGYIDLIDCDDNNANVWRLLNGYADNDKDRYGSWNRISICSGNTLPSGYSYIGRDCDDSNAAINPMVIDRTCDGIDNNCNGRIDESYIRLVTTCGTGLCMSMGNLQCISGNVIDSCTPKVSSPEKCNNLFDDDCDGKIDKADEDCIAI